ncbi:MAG: carbohydrate binding domain-containing protein [Armatimonadota bacterium]
MRTALCVLLCLILAVAAHAVPTATALKADAPPVLDGLLNDVLWQGAPQMKDFVVLGSNAPAAQQTQAWIAYDADNLYIAVKALDAEMGKLKAAARDRDGKVFSDDVIELFFDPGRTGFSMIQLGINPLGTQADLMGDAVGMSINWNGLWTVKTARGVDFWTAELAIPFANFGLSKSVGPEWAINICRERRASGELSQWSQTGGKFSAPKSFGLVTIPADLTPFYVDLGVEDWGQGIIGLNALQFTLRNSGQAARKVDVRLEVTGPDGKAQQLAPVSVSVAPGKIVKQSLAYDLTASGTHLLMLKALDGERLVAAQGRALPVAPLADFHIYKSFYRDYATFRYQLNVQKQHLPKYRVSASLQPFGTDKVLEVKAVDAPKTQSGELRFATDKLPQGQYEINVAVLDRDGKSLISDSLRFGQLRDPAVKNRMVTLRPSDHMLIVEGKPFFPIGLYEAPGTETYLKRLSEAGFNLCHSPSGSGPALQRLLDRVQQYDMKMWISMSGLLDFSKDADKKRQQMTDIVNSVGTNPGLLVWESMDEPVWGSQPPEAYYEGYSFLRTLDQHRPIWTNHAPRNSIAELSNWNRATDISGLDVYPVPEPQTQSDLPNKTISVVGDEYEKNVAAVNGDKPIFMVLQGFGWAELSKVPGKPVNAIMPSFQQSRFMAYQSIVRGANGVLYWGTHYTAKPSKFWSELRSLVSELAALQGVLASESLTGKAAASVAQPKTGVRLIHKRVGGFNYVIVVNEGAESVPVQIALPGLKATSLRRLFENANVPVAKQTAKLTLTGYDVAVLSDNRGFADKRKDFSDEWKNPAPATDPAALKEPGNLIYNPGFEVDADGDLVPDMWAANVPLTVSLSPEAHAGKYSLSITGVGGDMGPLVVQRGTGIVAGKNYRFSAWVKASPTAEFRFYVEWHTDTWHSQCLPFTKGTGEWQLVTLPIKGAPDPQGSAYSVAQMKGTGTVLFDELKIEEVK